MELPREQRSIGEISTSGRWTCCPAAQKLDQLEVAYNQLLTLQREQSVRLQQLQDQQAWLSSQHLDFISKSTKEIVNRPSDAGSGADTVFSNPDLGYSGHYDGIEDEMLSFPVGTRTWPTEYVSDAFENGETDEEQWHRSHSRCSSFTCNAPSSILDWPDQSRIQFERSTLPSGIICNSAIGSGPQVGVHGEVDGDHTDDQQAMWDSTYTLSQNQPVERNTAYEQTSVSTATQAFSSAQFDDWDISLVMPASISHCESIQGSNHDMTANHHYNQPNHAYALNLQSELRIPLSTELSLGMLDLNTGFNTDLPKWKLDKYIMCLGKKLRQNLASVRVPKNLLQTVVAEGVLWIVREAWPAAETYWKVTASFRGFLQCEIWRNFPCSKSYAEIHPAYRPTTTQLTVPHCPIIDWLPWPDLRDLVIKHQNSIDVDMVCKTAIQNVISHRQPAPPPRQAKRARTIRESAKDLPSFRVWDICSLEKASSPSDVSLDLWSSDLTYKPQSASAVALQKAYGLVYDDFTTQKLDSAFFKTYPFLYCKSAASGFCVQEMPAVHNKDVGVPVDLSMSSVQKLDSLMLNKLGQV